MAHRPTWRIRKGDVLKEDATAARSRVRSSLTDQVLRQRLDRSDPMDFITVPLADRKHWTIARPHKRREVNRMARNQTQQRTMPTPPKMTRQEWLKRDRTTVSLTRGELEQLGKLIAAGHVLLRNEPSVSPKLKAAMTRLGINTKGL